MRIPKTNIEKRKVIRKATRLIIPALEKHLGTDKVVEVFKTNGHLYWDIIKVLQAYLWTPDHPNYKTYEPFMPLTIPHDIFKEAMNIPDKILQTAIRQGSRDCGYTETK